MKGDTKTPTARPLLELSALFFRLGTTAFGGPAAHIAMMEEEIVRRRSWLSREEFLDLLGATNLIPGPNSTEMAIHIGYRRAGWRGLVAAGVCFILPAAALVLGLAWAYTRYGSLPLGKGLLYGVKPVVIAVVLQALVSLTRTAFKTSGLAVLALSVAALNVYGLDEVLLLFLAGGLALATNIIRRPGAQAAGMMFPLLGWALASAPKVAFGLGPLFLFFAKVGAVLFGSGYVLLAFLRADLVERWGWMSEAELMDAIAIGQVTPGPVFTTATFIGYLLGGLGGATVATLGIFLPAFVFVAVSGPLVPRLRRSATAGAFLDGVVAASLALMAVVTARLARSAVADVPTLVIFAGSCFLLFRYRVNSAWLVIAAATAGAALSLWLF